MLRIAALLISILISSCSYPPSIQSARNTVHPIVITYSTTKNLSKQYIYSTGSAVIVAPGVAVTALHVIEVPPLQTNEYVINQPTIVINNVHVPVSIIDHNKDIDIAIIRGVFFCPCAEIATNMTVDEPAISIGYPLYVKYHTQFVTGGHLQGISSDKLITTSSVAPGSSGGGVFVIRNNTYKLAGIIEGSAASKTGEHTSNTHDWMAVAVPSYVFERMIHPF